MLQNVSASGCDRQASVEEAGESLSTRIPEKRLSILLVDDSLFVGQLLKEYLRSAAPSLQVLGMARNPAEAEAVCKDFSPDVVVFDPMLAEGSPLEFTQTIVRLCPNSELMAFTRPLSDDLANQLIAAGVRCVLYRTCTLTELMEALDYVSDRVGQVSLTPATKTPLRRASRLTAREENMLRLIAEGCSTKEAAARLQIKQRNADKIRQRIMQKLDLHDAVRLARYAIRRGLVSI